MFVTPTETFEYFNSFQNVNNGVANPVTLHFKYFMQPIDLFRVFRAFCGQTAFNTNAGRGLQPIRIKLNAGSLSQLQAGEVAQIRKAV